MGTKTYATRTNHAIQWNKILSKKLFHRHDSWDIGTPGPDETLDPSGPCLGLLDGSKCHTTHPLGLTVLRHIGNTASQSNNFGINFILI